MEKSREFKPGLNWLSIMVASCITYINTKTGEVMNAFVVEPGTHLLRVPDNAKVEVENAGKDEWFVRNYDPHEHLDGTPIEVTVVRPRSMQDEVKHEVARLVAKALGTTVDALESPEDMNDFEMDDIDEAPLSIHQIKEMRQEAIPVDRSLTMDEQPISDEQPKTEGKEETKPVE